MGRLDLNELSSSVLEGLSWMANCRDRSRGTSSDAMEGSSWDFRASVVTENLTLLPIKIGS